MYSRCIFCSADLDHNDDVEHFQVGRRLAFDSARGWLWAVCRACGRWNLTPIDERWEAIEDAERMFRATPLRTSTPTIGLARLRSGVELVRIGKANDLEFAAWRYGHSFGRRLARARAVATATTLAAAGVTLVTGAFGFLPVFLPGAGMLLGFHGGYQVYRLAFAPVARVRLDSGMRGLIQTRHANAARIVRDTDGAIELEVAHVAGRTRLHGAEAIDVASRVSGAERRARRPRTALARSRGDCGDRRRLVDPDRPSRSAPRAAS
jgi:hypothetical protein